MRLASSLSFFFFSALISGFGEDSWAGLGSAVVESLIFQPIVRAFSTNSLIYRE
jgi:hypothetical protein